MSCRQNYLDVRKCGHCNLRMLVDEFGLCGICGQFVMSWVFERTLADTLKPDQAAAIDEYLSARSLPSIAAIRVDLSGGNAGRQISAHGRHRLGNSGHSSGKIRRRSGRVYHNSRRPSQKPLGRWNRDIPEFKGQFLPADEFWNLFDSIKAKAEQNAN